MLQHKGKNLRQQYQLSGDLSGEADRHSEFYPAYWHIFHAVRAKPTIMQELINSLQKTGLSREQAQSAVTHVLDYLKQRLPESVHPYVDQAATGKSSRDMFSGLANTVGGYIRKQPI